MYKKTEYLLELERLEYDLESKKMELKGLKKEYSDFKFEIIAYVIPLVIMIVFFRLTVGSEICMDAFRIVLSPILIILIGIYVVYMIKKFWNIYLNKDSGIARKLAQKCGKRSVAEEIDKCMMDISKYEIKVENLRNKIENEQFD